MKNLVGELLIASLFAALAYGVFVRGIVLPLTPVDLKTPVEVLGVAWAVASAIALTWRGARSR